MLLTRKDSNFLIENMSMLFRTKFFALVFSDSKNTCEFYHIQKQPKEVAKDDRDLCVFESHHDFPHGLRYRKQSTFSIFHNSADQDKVVYQPS